MISDRLLQAINEAGCCKVKYVGHHYTDIVISRPDRSWQYYVELNPDMSDQDVFTLLNLYKVPDDRLTRAWNLYHGELDPIQRDVERSTLPETQGS
jgi:hypothetical protein